MYYFLFVPIGLVFLFFSGLFSGNYGVPPFLNFGIGTLDMLVLGFFAAGFSRWLFSTLSLVCNPTRKPFSFFNTVEEKSEYYHQCDMCAGGNLTRRFVYKHICPLFSVLSLVGWAYYLFRVVYLIGCIIMDISVCFAHPEIGAY